jgi:hypothetical protein
MDPAEVVPKALAQSILSVVEHVGDDVRRISLPTNFISVKNRLPPAFGKVYVCSSHYS